jgi:hypothetical protein
MVFCCGFIAGTLRKVKYFSKTKNEWAILRLYPVEALEDQE